MKQSKAYLFLNIFSLRFAAPIFLRGIFLLLKIDICATFMRFDGGVEPVGYNK